MNVLNALDKPKSLAVDFYCGAGGTTRGLLDAGGYVIAGVDKDEGCRDTYLQNNENNTLNVDENPFDWATPPALSGDLLPIGESRPQRVFLDASIVIKTGKPPGGPLFRRLVALVNAGFMSVITTDLTKQEVAKHYMELDYEVVKCVRRRHFRNLVLELLNVKIPEVTSHKLRAHLMNQYEHRIAQMFETLNAHTMSIDTVKPSFIFSDYVMSRGFFGEGVKKEQFADAFIFEALKNEVSDENPIIIVSQDSDFDKAAREEEHIIVLTSLESLFEHFNLSIQRIEPIERFLHEQRIKLQTLIENKLDHLEFDDLDVDEAQIQIEVVSGLDFANITGFRTIGTESRALVLGSVDLSLGVSYEHPDWDLGIYDREDDIIYTFDNVYGEQDIEIRVDFVAEIDIDERGTPVEIGNLEFVNDGFFFVQLYQNDY